ncbi:L-threonylcarbamoyladenylate synthase [Paracoccus beibuensis]|uniref:L-threonylcarbamoyladenylate synthase n=1 Tax=Paracoccus beibuensis TaxID=547602 RepID=UPI00223E9EA0|nr:L-threonylcarbamoyladenylate synthase [Paracoccus beibuensis]
MQTLRLLPDSPGLARAARLLAEGQCVAIPTETVYGLAADARNGEAVARIYQAKGRPSFNPLIVHVADLAAAEALGQFDAQARLLADRFWPGALTLILPLQADSGIASLVTAGLQTIGLRVPAHSAAQALLRTSGAPLAAPSANASGRISPTSADHVLAADGGLRGRIAAVLDAGPCPVGVESTIVGWPDGRPALLRPGGIAAEAIESVLGQPLAAHHADPSAPSAPGQLTSHYAPKAPLRLNAEPQAGETHLTFGQPGPFSLSDSGDLAQAAARLFDLLRRADETGRPISVAPIPEHGLGAAINDRLRRAAAPRN